MPPVIRFAADTAAEIDPVRACWARLCGFRHQHDVVAEVAQTLNQLGRRALAGDLIEVALAEVAEA